ncbi:hypothetical protein AGR56_04945 [Clostridium sp. DMHC 10]|uniref:type II secretion system protein n=1 Tax=Clostridium sp. DMHC 10 TaxID=747377 RepID=UPI00069F0E24|nr:type II secretion system protein [Clostridium sp. DMHC 10]KOF56223.1 hypothetical protein AGR56_04945 [Clostridium sp. DMHC 10]
MKLLKDRKKKKGFTLIELIAVVAILVILAVILIPNVMGYVHNSKIATVRSNAKIVLNVIRTAKANSDTPDQIVNYTTAITNNDTIKGDPNLAPSNSIPANLQSKTEDELESIIDDNSGNWSDFSQYY